MPARNLESPDWLYQGQARVTQASEVKLGKFGADLNATSLKLDVQDDSGALDAAGSDVAVNPVPKLSLDEGDTKEASTAKCATRLQTIRAAKGGVSYSCVTCEVRLYHGLYRILVSEYFDLL
jgi:hypothetical protein